MDFNTICIRFGINPNDIENEYVEPIPYKDGFIYEFHQKKKDHICPKCKSNEYVIKDYNYIEIKAKQNEHINDILRIKKVRLKCKRCNKTFTPKIAGINPYDSITYQSKQFIINDFYKFITFEQIAKKYGLSKTRIIQIFDDNIKYISRLKLPKILCIDEFKFSKEDYIKYCCVLTNFENKEIVDIIVSRKMPYLREYFSNISIKERSEVKYLISDMYNAYDTICHQYLPNALHIVDLFHVIRLLSNAVNQLRTRTMNLIAIKNGPEYNFMKKNWKYFLCRYKKIPLGKIYTHKKTNIAYEYQTLLLNCLKLDINLWHAHSILQEMLEYDTYFTYEEALNFILRIINKLELTSSELLHKVAKTFHEYRYEIANGLNKKSRTFKYSNSIAENINNHIKTLIKISYGYKNFQRFRKRMLLISSNSKKHEN